MKPQPNPPSFIGLAAMTGALGYAAYHLGPVAVGGEIKPLAAAVSALTALSALGLAEQALRYTADVMDWIGAHTGTGKSGTAQWGKYRHIKKELCKEHAGPFWGLFADGNKPAFIDFESNAYVVGPSGSGKGHTIVVPLIFLFPHSKVIMDFKPELLSICQKGLEEMGQTVIPIAPFGAKGIRLARRYCLNPLDAITDNLFRADGLDDVFTDADELAFKLYEEPPNANDDDYWRDGSREILSIVTISISMMKGYDGTFKDVALLLANPYALEAHLNSILGLALDGSPDPQGPYLFELCDWAQQHSEEDLAEFLGSFRAKSTGLLALMRTGEKTFGSYLQGAKKSVKPYGFGRQSKAMEKTNFDFDSIKDGNSIINLFVVGKAKRPKATEKFFGIMQWVIQLKMKDHQNSHVPVYFICDEASNYSIYDLLSLMTYGRGFGILLIQIFQNFPAYEKRYGKEAVEVLNSESEIKLFLPGQRCETTIKKIVNMAGQQSVMVASLSSGGAESTSESGRPLITEDELRRSEYGILLVRKHSVFLQKPVSYSEIHPLRELADINPHKPKPFLRKVRLKLNMKLPKK